MYAFYVLVVYSLYMCICFLWCCIVYVSVMKLRVCMCMCFICFYTKLCIWFMLCIVHAFDYAVLVYSSRSYLICLSSLLISHSIVYGFFHRRWAHFPLLLCGCCHSFLIEFSIDFGRNFHQFWIAFHRFWVDFPLMFGEFPVYVLLGFPSIWNVFPDQISIDFFLTILDGCFH